MVNENDSRDDDDYEDDLMQLQQQQAVTSDLVSYFKSLPKKPETTVRIFNVKEKGFYVLIGSDADLIAKEVRKSSEGVRQHDIVGSFIIQSQSQFESEVRDILLVRQYRIEVHKRETAASSSWGCEFVSSPGNFGPLEDVLYSARDNLEARGLLIIHSTVDRYFGAVLMDEVSKVIRVTSFQDDSHLSNLESVLVQFAPREAVVSTNYHHKELVEDKLKLNNVLVTSLSFEEFFQCTNHEDLIASLKRILVRNTVMKQVEGYLTQMKGPGKRLVSGCITAGIKYLSLHCALTMNQFEWKEENLDLYVKLDSAAVTSLNLFPSTNKAMSKSGGSGEDYSNVFGILNKCRTLCGQRLLSQWLRQPLKDLRRIEVRQSLVEYFVNDSGRMIQINETALRALPDLSRISRAFASKKGITLEMMYQLYRVTKDLSKLADSVGGDDDLYVRSEIRDVIHDLTNRFKNYNQMVDEILDFDRIKSHREYCLVPSFDVEMGRMMEARDKYHGKVDRVRDQVTRDLGIEVNKFGSNLKLKKDKTVGYYFSVSNAYEKSVRARKHEYTQLPNPKKDGYRFTCEELENLSPKLMDIEIQMEVKESEIMQEITDTVSGYAHTVKSLSDVLSFLDVVVGLAVVAVSNSYIKPNLSDPKESQGVMKITQLRHPCLELISSGFIPNDVEMSGGDEGKKFLLITGPNMGGKSTYVRSIAIAVLLAQVGSFIPAESAEMSVMDGIFTRVGGCDQQLLGNSTFMSEMIETTNILRCATENSLIILDELGRGTSTFDGFGIAYAVSKHIAAKIKAFCLFATHFQEMVRLEREVSTVATLHTGVHCEEGRGEEGKVTFMYSIKPGPCLKSYGIQVAKSAGIPSEYIKVAEEKLAELEETMGAAEGGGGDCSKWDLPRMIQEVKGQGKDIDSMTDEEVDALFTKVISFKKE